MEVLGSSSCRVGPKMHTKSTNCANQLKIKIQTEQRCMYSSKKDILQDKVTIVPLRNDSMIKGVCTCEVLGLSLKKNYHKKRLLLYSPYLAYFNNIDPYCVLKIDNLCD